MKSRPRVLCIVLAGGEGSRLKPLTNRRAKPAVSFGGTYRLIDFALSNLANAGLGDVWIVEQYLPHSLADHIAGGRPWDLDRSRGGLRTLPPYVGGERDADGFAEGNADALYRSLEPIRAFAPDVIVTLSADHIVKFDPGELVDQHLGSGAAVTMGVTDLPGEDVSRYAVVGVEGNRIVRFDYKPEAPEGHTVATEVFAYNPQRLFRFFDEYRNEDGDEGREDETLGDYGDELIPQLVAEDSAQAFPMSGYWRDVGTIDSLWRANMDLLDHPDLFRLNDPEWPIRTRSRDLPPARVVPGATVENSLLAPGAHIAGTVRRSVIGRGVSVQAGATVEDTVIFDDTTVRAGVKIRRAIIDERESVSADVFGGEEIAVWPSKETQK